MKKKKLLPGNYFLIHPISSRTGVESLLLYEYEDDPLLDPTLPVEEVFGEEYIVTEQERDECKQVEMIQSEKALFRWMRKTYAGIVRRTLMLKMVEMEDTTNRIIEKHLPVSRVGLFYENCAMYMLYSKKNYCGWIQEHWNEFSEDYVRSILSLVLGVRGDPSMVPFLMEKVEELEYRDKKRYEQGPLLALERLQERFE